MDTIKGTLVFTPTTRRKVLGYGAGAFGTIALEGLFSPANAAGKPFKIAMSNAYNGNGVDSTQKRSSRTPRK